MKQDPEWGTEFFEQTSRRGFANSQVCLEGSGHAVVFLG